MTLADYEQQKFELAAILRSAITTLRESNSDSDTGFGGLLSRLAEDTFNLVVVGRFSRGKSSLMNAMLHTESLPTGIVPLTSVITTVRYGSDERAYIDYENWHLSKEITLEDLPDYVTQIGNPANCKRVTLARVELPAELLRRGFYFVDTPGLESAILENTRTTERFLPEADAFMLVTSFDSPLSGEELNILRTAATSSRQIFIVVNKRDTVTVDEQAQAVRHLEDQSKLVFGDALPQLFPLSAREALEAIRGGDVARWQASGVPKLVEELTRFLLTEKQTSFLLRMCERIDEVIGDNPKLQNQQMRLRDFWEKAKENRASRPATAAVPMVHEDRSRFLRCAICDRLEREMYDYLCGYQYEIGTRAEAQDRLAEQAGLCAFHTWQYEAMASPHGTCLGFSPLLERTAARMRDAAARGVMETFRSEVGRSHEKAGQCDLCRKHLAIERANVEAAAASLSAKNNEELEVFSGFCLRHLELVVGLVGSEELARELLIREARLLELISDDMRRYALKHDGVRRHLASSEEIAAARRALTIMAGNKNVGGLWRAR